MLCCSPVDATNNKLPSPALYMISLTLPQLRGKLFDYMHLASPAFFPPFFFLFSFVVVVFCLHLVCSHIVSHIFFKVLWVINLVIFLHCGSYTYCKTKSVFDVHISFSK